MSGADRYGLIRSNYYKRSNVPTTADDLIATADSVYLVGFQFPTFHNLPDLWRGGNFPRSAGSETPHTYSTARNSFEIRGRILMALSENCDVH